MNVLEVLNFLFGDPAQLLRSLFWVLLLFLLASKKARNGLFAQRLNISVHTVADYENGKGLKIRSPSSKDAIELSFFANAYLRFKIWRACRKIKGQDTLIDLNPRSMEILQGGLHGFLSDDSSKEGIWAQAMGLETVDHEFYFALSFEKGPAMTIRQLNILVADQPLLKKVMRDFHGRPDYSRNKARMARHAVRLESLRVMSKYRDLFESEEIPEGRMSNPVFPFTATLRA